MKILIAEDDVISRRLLQKNLEKMEYDVIPTKNGKEAWDTIRSNQEIKIAVLDWMMPELSGPDVCSKIRQNSDSNYIYTILLTAKTQKDDILTGLESGADDFITKPYDYNELLSRVKAGIRIIELENTLSQKIVELKDALDHVKQLQGIIPICMHCKKIRTDTNTWQQLEAYIENHSDASFTHSICEECLKKHYPEV